MKPFLLLLFFFNYLTLGNDDKKQVVDQYNNLLLKVDAQFKLKDRLKKNCVEKYGEKLWNEKSNNTKKSLK